MLKKLANPLITLWVWLLIPTMTLMVTLPIFFFSVFLAPLDPQRRWAHKCGTLWGKAIMKANPYWKLHLSGLHNIKADQSYVVISNHLSLADIIILFHLGIQFKWLAKTSLFYIPFFGWNMSLMKYIPLERGRHGSIRKSYQEAKRWLRQGMSVLIFPEGTRSRDGFLGEFKNGAFKMALELRKPILPIALVGTDKALPKGKIMLGARVKFSLNVLPPIDTRDYEPEDFEKLKNKVRSLIQKEIERKTISLPA